MTILSTRAFQRISLYLRGLIAIALLLLFSNAFTVSLEIARGALEKDSELRYLPSLWFLGICQWARGAADNRFRHLAFMGLEALLLAVVAGAIAFGLAYKRHFASMAELSGKRAEDDLWRVSSIFGLILDHTMLRTSFERAAFRFVARTLVRSDRHRVALAVFAAIGLVAATQYLIWNGVDMQGPNTAQFSAPLIILYCCILGLRFSFDMPVALNANWIFRFLIAPTLEECATFAVKAIFLLVLPMVVIASLVFGVRWGPTVGAFEFLISMLLSATLIAALVFRFRKLPFTCAKGGFQHNALVKVLLCVLGVFAFAILPATIEHWARLNPIRLLTLAPPLALIWWGIYEARAGQLEIDRRIVFIDPEQDGIELLNLSA